LQAQNAELARQLHALAADTNQGWVLITGTLIFFMQAGFAMLEAGSIRGRSTALIILKNLGDTVVGFLAWFLVGYAFAFGDESNSFLGFDKFALAEINRDVDYGYFFFQGCFASAAVTIVSGCLVERVRYRPYFLFSFLFNWYVRGVRARAHTHTHPRAR
jgi:Amt family ammonium transporter